MGAFWLHRGGSGTVFQGSHKPESLHQDSSFEGKSIEISLQAHTFVEHVSNLTLSNYDEAGHSISGVFMLDYHGVGGREPTGGQWVDRQAVAELAVEPDEHRRLLEANFDEAEQGDVPSEWPSWLVQPSRSINHRAAGEVGLCCQATGGAGTLLEPFVCAPRPYHHRHGLLQDGGAAPVRGRAGPAAGSE